MEAGILYVVFAVAMTIITGVFYESTLEVPEYVCMCILAGLFWPIAAIVWTIVVLRAFKRYLAGGKK